MKRTSKSKNTKKNKVRSTKKTPEKVVNKRPEFPPNQTKFEGKLEKYSLPLLIILILLIGIISVPDYLSTKKLYYFKDIGSDIINQDYPAKVEHKNLLRETDNPTWSFYRGMGTNTYRGTIHEPKGLINKSIRFIFKQILGENSFITERFLFTFFWHILLAGLIAFFYFRTINLHKTASLIGALLFAYLGYTVLGSSWGYAGIVFNGIFLLFAFEQMYLKNRWYFFPFAISYVVANPYYLYWFALFMLIYASFRLYQTKAGGKQIIALGIKTVIFSVIGFLLNATDVIMSYTKILNSPRVAHDVSGAAQNGGVDVFHIDNFSEHLTALFRLFSNDILGNGSDYAGWYNYLEAPIFYAGLLSLLLIPQLFTGASKRDKIAYGTLLGLWTITVLLPPLRNALHLYVGNYYKGVYDFIISFVIILTGISALSKIIEQKTIHLKTLIITALALVAVLIIPWNSKLPDIIDTEIQFVVIVFILIYTLIISQISNQKLANYIPLILIILVSGELIFMTGKTVNQRDAYRKSEFESTLGGYKDATTDALAYIKMIDSGFYRAEKDYSSGNAEHGSLNDAQAQGYFGTASYSSFNQYYYIRFLLESGVIPKHNETATRWAPGVRGIPLLMSFASVKYFFSKDKNTVLDKQGFYKLKDFDDVALLKNKYALPLGFTYDKFIRKSDFDSLGNVFSKSAMLLKAIVIEDDNSEFFNNQSGFKEIFAKDSLSATAFNFFIYDTLVSDLKQDTLQITSFTNSKIIGDITLEKPKMLFFSIPYDDAWQCKAGGKLTDWQLANLGFSACLLPAGEHHIELVYKPKYMYESFYLIVLAYLLLIGIFLMRKKIKLFDISQIEN